MFIKSEEMGDIVMTVPDFSRPVEPGLMELVDPSQQMPLWLCNFSQYTVEVQLFADEMKKQSYTLGPHVEDANAIGSDGSSQIHALILVCRPEFANMVDNPMVVFFKPGETKLIKAVCVIKGNRGRAELELRYRFAHPENAIPWTEAFEKS